MTFSVYEAARRFPVKLFEVRDRATTMPVMAIKLVSAGPAETHFHGAVDRVVERWLLQRAGYAEHAISNPAADPYIILLKLDGVEAQYDPHNWSHRRTLPIAHQHIIEHWSDLHSGDVIDVEFLLGETSRPKESERFTHGV